ncbi:MAG: hypothetical protein ABI542_11625 [Gemmatimonadota bacterium]
MYPSVFGRTGGVAARGDNYYVYDPAAEIVERFDRDGRVTGKFGRSGAGSVLGEADRQAVRARLIAETPAEEHPGEMFDESPIPAQLPRYGWAGFRPRSPFVVGNDGSVWIVQYGGVHDLVPRWEVYDSAQVFQGVVAGPERSWLHALDQGKALLVIRDPDGVETAGVWQVPLPTQQ